MGTTEERGEDGVASYDARPQQTSNRPGDPDGPATARWLDRRSSLQGLARSAVPDPIAQGEDQEDVLVQVATVFGYAMVGAVLFHVGWWAFTGG